MRRARALVLVCALAAGAAGAFACGSTDPINPVLAGAPADSGALDSGPREAGKGLRSGIVVRGPLVLSETGLYSDFDARVLAPGVLEYAPRWPVWNDGAAQRRWIQLPPGKKVDTSDMDQWTFPEGTKLWMALEVDGVPVETRFLWKRGTGWDHWWMAAYVWREDASDADFFEEGAKNVLGTTHDVPTQTQCVQCHDGVVDVGVGFSALQLSAPKDSQLARFSSMGMLAPPATREYEPPGIGASRDALVALHANCGNCHVETSRLYWQQTRSSLHLRVGDTTVEQTGAYQAVGLKIRHIDDVYGLYFFYPGNPSLSQAWLRMNVRTLEWAMPPFDTKEIDIASVSAVGHWIQGLPPMQDL